MGQDKGLMLLNGKPLITYVIETLKPITSQLLIVANAPGYEQFGFPVFQDNIPDKGPLGGLITGLQKSNTEKSIVLSCDTPFVSTALLSHLLEKSSAQKTVVALHQEEVQPLVGVYHKDDLKILENLREKDMLQMRRVIKEMEVAPVPIDEQMEGYSSGFFDNLNTPESMEAAARRLNPSKPD